MRWGSAPPRLDSPHAWMVPADERAANATIFDAIDMTHPTVACHHRRTAEPHLNLAAVGQAANVS